MTNTQTENDLLNIMRNLDDVTAPIVLCEISDENLMKELWRRLDKRSKQLTDILHAVSTQL